MPKTAIQLGPHDHGRRMSLEDFEPAGVREGYLYELGRGAVVVSDVPGRKHFAQVNAIRRQLSMYDAANPGQIYGIATGSECKILLTDLNSERHPDLAVYKLPPPDADDYWPEWVPEIVIEVVSPGSEAEHRDYVEKRQEYLAFGVREYWISDAMQRRFLILRRSRGRWAERSLGSEGTYRTQLLPGFELACAPIFRAADAVS